MLSHAASVPQHPGALQRTNSVDRYRDVTDRAIAQIAGVEHHLVGRARQKLEKEVSGGAKPQLKAPSGQSAKPAKNSRSGPEVDGL
jgi:hypothetical protein